MNKELETNQMKNDTTSVNIDNLYTVCDICTQIKNTNSTIEKQNILKKNENNELFKEILKFLLDPNIVTGISKKKINKVIKDTPKEFNHPEFWDEIYKYNILNLLNYLKLNNTGTDSDIFYCQQYIFNYDKLDEFLKSIVTKSLKLGVDIKTVNKVYGKTFIPKLDIMLGTSIEKCKIPQGTWFSISQKLNGSRCFYYKGQLYTRQGKIYTGCQHIIDDIQTLLYPVPNDIVVDGELLLKDRSMSDSECFQKGVGIANSDKETKTELKLVIFDMIHNNELENGVSVMTYKQRKSILNLYKTQIENLGLKNIEIVPMFYEGTDQNEIWRWLNYAEENDMEGVMLNLDKPYECKRTKNLIKVKKFYTLDLKVVDVLEGDGRLKNTLGALVVDYKGNQVNVGTGFSDSQRKYFWEHKDEIIDRVIEVKYKEITKNKDTNLESLQFPVFISLREQGKEVSYD